MRRVEAGSSGAMVAMVTHGGAEKYLDPAMKSNKALVLSAVQLKGEVLKIVSDELKADKAVFLAAVTNSKMLTA